MKNFDPALFNRFHNDLFGRNCYALLFHLLLYFRRRVCCLLGIMLSHLVVLDITCRKNPNSLVLSECLISVGFFIFPMDDCGIPDVILRPPIYRFWFISRISIRSALFLLLFLYRYRSVAGGAFGGSTPGTYHLRLMWKSPLFPVTL